MNEGSENYDELLSLIDLIESNESLLPYESLSREELIDMSIEGDGDAFLALIKNIHQISGLDYLESKKTALNWTRK